MTEYTGDTMHGSRYSYIYCYKVNKYNCIINIFKAVVEALKPIWGQEIKLKVK